MAKKTSKKRGPGRPTKFNPEIGGKLCQLIELGCIMGRAARQLHLDDDTIRNWLKAGEAPKGPAPLKEWAKRYRSAESNAQNRTVGEIVSMALMPIPMVEFTDRKGHRRETFDPAYVGLMKLKQNSLHWLAERRWPLELGTRAVAINEDAGKPAIIFMPLEDTDKKA